MGTPTSTGHRIAEAARRTGFSAATLRYYEEIGLLPPPARTDGGYRLYDDRDLERLELVARAKELGCSLEEIRELAPAWDDDACGSVQQRLHDLVEAKLRATRARIHELAVLAGELAGAAAALGGAPHRGPCGPSCPCAAAAPTIACSLGAGELHGRIDEWQRMLRHVTLRQSWPGGVRLELDPTVPLDELLRLVRAEQACCGFFAFSVTVDERGIGLEVTAPSGARDLLATLFLDAVSPASALR